MKLQVLFELEAMVTWRSTQTMVCGCLQPERADHHSEGPKWELHQQPVECTVIGDKAVRQGAWR